MKKWIPAAAFAAIMMTACGSDTATDAASTTEKATEAVKDMAQKATQEKDNSAIAKKIDDSIVIQDQAGSMKMTIKGGKVNKAMSMKGKQGIFVARQMAANLVEGKMGTIDGSYVFNFSFAPQLGFQSLDSRGVNVMLKASDSGVNEEVKIGMGKVSLTRAKTGDFLVGTITGIADMGGDKHSVFAEFQVPYTAMK